MAHSGPVSSPTAKTHEPFSARAEERDRRQLVAVTDQPFGEGQRGIELRIGRAETRFGSSSSGRTMSGPMSSLMTWVPENGPLVSSS
mgnify:CR=1 FL=1